MFLDDIEALATLATDRAAASGLKLATAESCTGGLVAAALTAIPGSSRAVERGFVTYSNLAKHEMLGVDMDLIERDGAVSESVARAMAEGAVSASGAHLAVSITGVAGPGGATPGKPVGLVHFAAAHIDGRVIHREERFGDIGRQAVRLASVRTALSMLMEMMV